MIKIFICEDMQIERDSLRKVIENVILIEDYDMTIELETANPHDILNYINDSNENKATGLYFLDVELGSDINGVELASKIREYDPIGFIVIITAHPEAMPSVFTHKVEPLDFINKSDFFNLRSNIEACVRLAHKRYAEQSKEGHKALSFKHDSKIYVVKFKDIISIETSTNKNIHKLTLSTPTRIYEFRGYLKDIETKLDNCFIRLHQSYVVNKLHIDYFDISKREVLMSNGIRFIVPRINMKATKKALEDI